MRTIYLDSTAYMAKLLADQLNNQKIIKMEDLKKEQQTTDNDASNLATAFGQPLNPTFGQKLVGYQFNPSGDYKVQRAKELCAELADLIYDDHKGDSATDLYDELYHHAIGEILNAQMNVVKVLTLKY